MFVKDFIISREKLGKQITFYFIMLFKKLFIFIYLFLAVLGLRFLCEGFLQLWQVGASHYRGLSCCGAQAPDAQAQYLWLTGRVAPRHVGSSQTRARTRVPCIGRQILNHCTTREALIMLFKKSFTLLKEHQIIDTKYSIYYLIQYIIYSKTFQNSSNW